MAASQDAGSRARLIREMSRDINRTKHSTGSSVSNHGSINGGTMSDFDPENEAIMSTRQIDSDVNQLPELRASAKKYGRYHRPEPDFAIDTSALGRAFPDFSQANSSSDDSVASIEIGRGGKRTSRGLEGSRNGEDDSLHSSQAMVGEYQVMYTPPLSTSRNVSKRNASNGGNTLRKDAQLRLASQSRKENQDPAPRVSKATDYVSNNGRQTNGERRTLADMHAKATEGYDGSYISDERPTTVTLTARNTRFGSTRNGQKPSTGKSVTAPVDAFLKELNGNKSSSTSQQPHVNGAHTTNTFTDNATHQSFMLPDLPNLSELVSGVYQDGTPVFSRHGKARTTRFASQSNPHSRTPRGQGHIPIDAIPIPEDEKAIFVSLKLLQDKVAELEYGKTDAEKRLEEMQEENATLKSERRELRRHRRSDSALGVSEETSDEGEAAGRRRGKPAASSILQSRLDAANRKVAVSEMSLKNLSQERDSAVAQLGVAYYTSEELKSENEMLRKENADLRAQLSQLAADRKSEAQRWANKEANFLEKAKQREEEVQKIREMTKKIWDSRMQKNEEFDVAPSVSRKKSGADLRRRVEGSSHRGEPGKSDGRISRKNASAKISGQINDELSRIATRQQDEALFSLDLETLTHPMTTSETVARKELPSPTKRNSSKPSQSRKLDENGQQRVKRVVVESVDDSDDSQSNVEVETGPVPSTLNANTSQDLTFLTFIDGREIAQLRKTLEEERAARKERLAKTAKDQTRTETIRSIFSMQNLATEQNLPRKSSMKNVSARLDAPAATAKNPTMCGGLGVNDLEVDSSENESRQVLEHHRRHSEGDSMFSTTRRRRRNAAEEMTSAFILPDITLGNVKEQPTLSESAQRVLDKVAQHDGSNCLVCKRVITEGTAHNHGEQGGKESIKITKPIPVSERMPAITPYNEEPTLRPSQPPALALATVMKGLEDELAHLKMELASYQAAYNKHDVSLSKRRRKSIYAKIERLLREIDTKADQIYALYDVLEGQKNDGHGITEQEVELTLQSIGIDLPGLQGNAAGTTRKGKPAEKHGGVEGSDESEDEELPWEGIETTGEVTGRSGRGLVGKRRGTWAV